MVKLCFLGDLVLNNLTKVSTHIRYIHQYLKPGVNLYLTILIYRLYRLFVMIVKSKRAEGWTFYGPIILSYVPSIGLAIVLLILPGQLITANPILSIDGLRCHSISNVYTYCSSANILIQSLFCLVSSIV